MAIKKKTAVNKTPAKAQVTKTVSQKSDSARDSRLNKLVDDINKKYGTNAVMRGFPKRLQKMKMTGTLSRDSELLFRL